MDCDRCSLLLLLSILGSCLVVGEFEEVVAEHAMAAPDSGAVVTAEAAAAPAAVPFEMRDPSLLNAEMGVVNYPSLGASRCCWCRW